MRAHVLLNFIIELGKSDKIRGLPSILSFFHNTFYKFDNTGARMSDYIYQMTLYCLKSHFRHENMKILRSFTQCYDGHHLVTLPIYKMVYHFYCMAVYHYQRRHNLIKGNILLKKAKIIVIEVRKVEKI